MHDVCVAGDMQIHAANRMPSAVIVPLLTAWAHARRATESLWGARRNAKQGTTWLMYTSSSAAVTAVARWPWANSWAEPSSTPGNR